MRRWSVMPQRSAKMPRRDVRRAHDPSRLRGHDAEQAAAHVARMMQIEHAIHDAHD